MYHRSRLKKFLIRWCRSCCLIWNVRVIFVNWYISRQNALYLYLSHRFSNVFKKFTKWSNKWYYSRHKNTQEMVQETPRTVDLNTYSILVDLLKFNKPWYLSWHLWIYRASSKLKSKISFQPMITRPPGVLCTRVPEHIKAIFYKRHQIQRETLRDKRLTRVAATFCAP